LYELISIQTYLLVDFYLDKMRQTPEMLLPPP